MKISIKAAIAGFLFTALLLISSNSFSNDYYYEGDVASEGDIIVDLVLARPLGFVGSGLGLVFQGVGLLFSVPGENFGETGEVLVEAPLNYTFNRPLGHFEE